jgi:hypothetical protein
MATQAQSAPLIQGVQSPDVIVNPQLFYAATRRQRYAMRSLTSWSGIGSSDSVQLRQNGIVAGLEVRVKGTLTFGGTIGTTTMGYNWPFNLAKMFRLSANGQSNLISANGLMIRAAEFVNNPKIQDQGRSVSFGGTASITDGSLKLSNDNWGTGSTDNLYPGTNVTTAEAKTFDITYFIPVAAHQVSLIGSVYAQSSATNLNLEIQWATQAEIVSALGASATLAYTSVQYSVTGIVYTIPNVNGNYVIPDLSQFHQVAQFRQSGLGQGTNQILLPGTGVGRNLLRCYWQAFSSSAPLAINDTNYATVGWGYGGNQIPEQYDTGQPLSAMNERLTGVHLGKLWGIGLWDFASENALRDVVDESTTADLRILVGLVSAPTSGYAEVCQETLFAAPVGA